MGQFLSKVSLRSELEGRKASVTIKVSERYDVLTIVSKTSGTIPYPLSL